jgi:hypothetical protein
MRLSTCLRAATTVVLLLLAPSIIYSQVPEGRRNEIEVRGVLSVPSGEASFSSNGTSGSVISFEQDFDFKNELGIEFRFTHRTASGKHKFQGNYSQATWSRSTNLSRSFTFRGETFTANLDTSSELRLNDFRVMYAYRWGNEKFRIGPMFDMGVIKTSLELNAATNSGTRQASGSISKFAATIGYDLDYDPSPRINIFNNLGAIRFQGERLFHVEGGARIYISHGFGFSGGYKAQRYRVEKDLDFLKIIAHGPFFGGVFRF